MTTARRDACAMNGPAPRAHGGLQLQRRGRDAEGSFRHGDGANIEAVRAGHGENDYGEGSGAGRERAARTSGGVVAGHVYGAGQLYSMQLGEQNGDDEANGNSVRQVNSEARAKRGAPCSTVGTTFHINAASEDINVGTKCGTTGHLQKIQCKKLNYMRDGKMNGDDDDDELLSYVLSVVNLRQKQ